MANYWSGGKLPITASIEILVLIAVGYNFISWSSYTETSAMMLGALACWFSVSGWLTTRASFDVYNWKMLILDILVIFSLCSMPGALKAGGQWGYSPAFWAEFAFIEFLYAAWDLMLLRFVEDKKDQKKYTFWMWISLGACLLMSATCLYQLSLSQIVGGKYFPDQVLVVGRSLEVCAAMYALSIDLYWNWDRYNIEKKAAGDFLVL